MRAADARVERANTTLSVLTTMTDSLTQQAASHEVIAKRLLGIDLPRPVVDAHRAVAVALGELRDAYFEHWTAEVAATDPPKVRGRTNPAAG